MKFVFAHTGECDAAEWDAESWAKQEVEEASLLTLLKETKQVQQEINVFSTDIIRKEGKR